MSMKGLFTQVSKAKVDENILDPLSALADSLKVTESGKTRSTSIVETPYGTYHVKDEPGQTNTSGFVTVEKLKTVGEVTRKDSGEITPKKSMISSLTNSLTSDFKIPSWKKRSQSPTPPSRAVSATITTNATAPFDAEPGNGLRISSTTTTNTAAEEVIDIDNFPFLSGEAKIMSMPHATVHIIPLGTGINGVLYMTNYRLVFVPASEDLHRLRSASISLLSYLTVPLACVDKLDREKRVAGGSSSNHSTVSSHHSGTNMTILIYCKDCRQLRINIRATQSVNGDYDLERAFSLISTYAFPNNLRYLFAFSHTLGGGIGPRPMPTLLEEYSRMGLLHRSDNLWRLTHANVDFKLCGTYPEAILTPSAITDDELFVIASFRSGHRLPALCWGRREGEGVASLWRSSQPKAGVSGSCLQDERMLDIIAQSIRRSHGHSNGNGNGVAREATLFIVDARSRNSAMANMAAGAGYETQNHYPACRLDFHNIPNIHAVRDSYKQVCALVLNPTANPSSDISFTKTLEDSNWLTNIRLILKASHETAVLLAKDYPVLVHCSHGWDRTSQITALAQLLVDPFYRTIDGFCVLIEKEWLQFGHPFQMRCAHGQDKTTRQDNEFSPIFIQFLDCVWQMHRLYRRAFEFNHHMILQLADELFAGRFGTFLFSSELDRKVYQTRTQSADLWQYIDHNRRSFTNRHYDPAAHTGFFLPPVAKLLRGVTLWSDFFLRWSSTLSLPTLSGEQRSYLHQLERLELREEEEQRQQKLLQRGAPNNSSDSTTVPTIINDWAVVEQATENEHCEALWAQERLLRLEEQTSLMTTKRRAQDKIMALLQLLGEKAGEDVMQQAENMLSEMELRAAEEDRNLSVLATRRDSQTSLVNSAIDLGNHEEDGEIDDDAVNIPTPTGNNDDIIVSTSELILGEGECVTPLAVDNNNNNYSDVEVEEFIV